MDSTKDHWGADAARSVDRDLFREVIGHFTSGVTVVTARHDETDFGLTASAVTSLSLDPPMLLVCINKKTGSCRAIARSRRFAINILDEDQGELAHHFATPGADKFKRVDVSYGRLGVPLLPDVLAHLECRVAEEVTGGTHSVFLAEASHAHAREGAPLAYFRGGFGRFESPRDEEVFHELRERILSREISVGHSLDDAELARELGVGRSSVYHALTKLSTEGLITREAGRGYVVSPLTARALQEALDARAAIELGVVDQTIGCVPSERLRELRRRMEATVPLIAEGRFVDLARYIEANTAFHECMVGLADNDVLLDLYRRLSAEAIMMRTLHGSDAANEALIDDHRRLAEAYEAGDGDEARKVILRHIDRAQELGRRAMEAAGGRL